MFVQAPMQAVKHALGVAGSDGTATAVVVAGLGLVIGLAAFSIRRMRPRQDYTAVEPEANEIPAETRPLVPRDLASSALA